MVNGPEGLSPAHSPEAKQNKLSSIFSFTRRLKDITYEAINYYKEAPFTKKASLGFLTLASTDMVQVVANRFILNHDPLIATVELISDL